jgi:hypothetical protein
MESPVQSRVGPPTDKYAMRYQDIIQESVALQYMNPYADKAYPIYKNANSTVFHNLINGTKFNIRGLLDTSSGDLYIWDAYAADHREIKKELGLVAATHLILYPNSAMVVPSMQSGSPPLTREMSEPVQINRNVKRLFGVEPQVFVMGFDDEWSDDDDEDNFS